MADENERVAPWVAFIIIAFVGGVVLGRNSKPDCVTIERKVTEIGNGYCSDGLHWPVRKDGMCYAEDAPKVRLPK